MKWFLNLIEPPLNYTLFTIYYKTILFMSLQSLSLLKHCKGYLQRYFLFVQFVKKDENYYLQVFLKECKYIEKKVIRYINDNLSDFRLLISVTCASKNIEHHCTQKKGNAHKKSHVVLLKLCLQCIKIQILYNKLYSNFLWDKFFVCHNSLWIL